MSNHKCDCSETSFKIDTSYSQKKMILLILLNLNNCKNLHLLLQFGRCGHRSQLPATKHRCGSGDKVSNIYTITVPKILVRFIVENRFT